MQSKIVAALLAVVACAGSVAGDVYMQSPRGSNGRNCEKNVNRQNANRLMDTQNNAKGGYACPRAVGGPEVQTAKTYYYVGEKVLFEWTNQHGGGGNDKLHTDVIWQYACEDTLDPTQRFRSGTIVGTPRDGTPQTGNDDATDTIPDNAADAVPNTDARRAFGMHESYDYYQECQRTERNKGLYTADQNMNRNDARATRQNNNGNRNGLECPEERDYYPYWRPTPWRDIAVITSEWSPNKEAYYQQNSQNTALKGECIPAGGYPATGEATSNNADFQQKRQQRDWYNNKAQCEGNGHTWLGVKYHRNFDPNGHVSPAPLIIQGEKSRINHLGNSEVSYKKFEASLMTEVCRDNSFAASTGRGGCQASGKLGTNTYVDKYRRMYDDNVGGGIAASQFTWSVPDNANENCVLRLRYNISTWDFPGFKGGNRYLSFADTFTGEPGIDARYNCRNNNNGAACTTVSPLTQDPYVRVRTSPDAGANILSLALNTNQYARTFQDRTYVFEIRARPADVGPNVNIVSLSVKGKRGNIVQTFPSTEYDFQPSELVTDKDDLVHFQWTGSDYNPQRGCNNGEGGPPDTNGNQNLQAQIQAAANNGRADRSNIVFMEDPGHNVPMGAVGEDEDLLATNLYNAGSDAKIPFAQVSDAWDLAYIGQEAQVAARGAQCLTQAQLENINNQNRRENHPLNCAKLNAAVTPYFDGGLKKMSNPGNYSAMSTRNNNFSNRDMTLKMCIRKTAGDNSCDPKFDTDGVIDPRTRPPAGTEQAATQPVNPIGTPSESVGNIKGDPSTPETFAPDQKDNDSMGDGEAQSCEERLRYFLASLSMGGIIAIAIAMIACGVLATLVVQSLYGRVVGDRRREQWYKQEGASV